MKCGTYWKSWLVFLLVPILWGCSNAIPEVESLFIGKADSGSLNPYTVTLNQAASQTDPTNSSSVQFDVVFSSAIKSSSFSAGVIALDPTSTGTVTTWTLTNLGDDKNFLLIGSLTSAGIIKPMIPAGVVQTSDGLSTFSASTSTDNSVFYDTVGPTVSINQALTQFDPTTSFPIMFTLVFNEAINPATLTTSDISNTGTATGVVWTIINSGDNTTFTLSADSATSSSGTISPYTTTGAVTDTAGNTSSASVSADGLVSYDGTIPTVVNVTSSSANGSYSSGSSLTIQVVFSEAVIVTGTPQLELETGATDRRINYSSGSGTTTLSFSYVVSASDVSSDLNYTSTSALTLNAGTIADAAGNAAVLSLPTLASAQSLASSKNFVIIGTPALLNISDGPTYDFGSVPTSVSVDKTFTVTNTGGFQASSLSGAGLATPFSFKDGSYPGTGGSCSDTLVNGGSCTLVVTYNPVSVGPHSDSLDLSYNDGLNPQTTNGNLQGTGVSPALLSISDGPTYDFGTVSMSSFAYHNFTITNSGGLPATGLSGSGLTSPFYFKGGSYPGTGGDCGASLANASSCTIVVKFAPTAIGSYSDTIEIPYNDGVTTTMATRDVQGTGGLLALSVVPVYGTNNGDSNTNWNDYIRYNNDFGGTNPYNQNIEACDGTETGYYDGINGCIHSGEKKKVIVTGINSCIGLTISDNLGVFNWMCDASSGTATFYSIGLQPGKGLRDLISAGAGGGTGSWQSNYVTVANGAAIGTSGPAAWWSNAITEAPATDTNSNAVISLSTSGTIYYVHTSRQYHIVDIIADKISLVTLGATSTIGENNYSGGGAGLCNTANGSIGAGILSILCINDIKFAWIEANLVGNNGVTWVANTGIFAYNLKYSRIHRTSMNGFHTNVIHPGLNLTNSSNNLVSESEIATVSKGVYLSGSTYNTFRGLKIADSRGTSAAGTLLQVAGSSIFNRFYDLTLMNVYNSTSSLAQGISVSASNNIFQRVMISNINGPSATAAGIKVAATGNIFVQVGAFSTTNTGLLLAGATSNIFSHVTSANNFYNGIYFTSVNSNNYFQSISIANTQKGVESPSSVTGSGNVFQSIASTNNTTYGFDFATNGLVTFPGYIMVGNNGTADCVGTPNACINATSLVSSVNLSTAFVGKVTSDDSRNTSDANGSGAPTSLTGYLYFDNWLRGWGLDGAMFPAADNRGYCSGTCRIWDWRTKASSALHNKSGDGVTANEGFSPSSACPSAVHGNQASIANAKTFLRNAVEIDGDYIGNDNGLCESTESCLYAPNIGAYQGEGTKIGPCTFTDGAVTGVSIYSYSTTSQ